MEALLAEMPVSGAFPVCFSRSIQEQPLVVFLTERLTEYEGGKDREKTARKVRNWLHDRNLPKTGKKRLRSVSPWD